MATDYLTRMYWPEKRPETSGENFTTYGKTIGMTAKLSAADRKAASMGDYKMRHQAFMQMMARQRELEDGQSQSAPDVVYNSGTRASTPHRHQQGMGFHQRNRSKTFMVPANAHAGHSVTTMPLDIALYNAPSCDPFVPNNSYKQYVTGRNQHAQGHRQLPPVDSEMYEGMLPVHRLYRSAGGYDDTIKASNHIRHYRPDVKDVSEYKVRQGRNGGAWRHVKEVMQGKGQRIMFVDGITSIDDLARIQTNMIRDSVRAPRPITTPVKDNYTTYVTPGEFQATEGVNWNVMR